MSLRTVIGGIGAAVGGFFGGPTGAQLGWALGSVVGNVVDPQTIQGPRLGDIAQQTSQEGGPIPIVFGMSPPITGNVIATSAPRITRTRSGGKGGPRTVSESAFRTYAIGVCEGPIAGFTRVWRNNILVYDASENPILEDEDNELFLETARLFLGTYSQEASPDLEAIFGVGTTAAHRGIAYMVMADEDLTDMGGAIPQWQFQVGAASTATVYTEDGTWTNPGSGTITVTVIGGGGGGASGRWGGMLEAHNGGGGGGAGGYSTQEFLASELPDSVAITVGQGGAGGDAPSPPPPLGNVAPVPGEDGEDSSFGDLLVAGGGLGADAAHAGGAGGAGTTEDGGDGSGGSGATGTPPNDGASGTLAPGGGGGGAGYTSAALSTPGGAGGVGSSSLEDPSLGGTGGAAGNIVGGSGTAGESATITTGTVRSGGGGGGGGGGKWLTGPVAGAGGNGAAGGYPGGGGGGGGASPKAGDSVYESPGSGAAGADGVVVVQASQACVTLPSIIQAICTRAGISTPLQDVSEIDSICVPGFVVSNQYAASQALQALAEIYQFDPSCYDSQIHFIPRGGNSVATITEDDMVDDDAEVEQSKRGNAIAIPRLLNLNYYDADTGGLTSAKQVSERPVTGRNTANASIQSPVVMSSETAAQAADILHKVMEEENKGELRFNLPDSFLELVPSSPIIVQWNQRSERARIVQCEIMDGFQSYVALRDRQSAFTSEVEGIPPPLPTVPVSRVVGPTLIAPLDIPLLRDADDNLGMAIYIAIAGTRESWGGAQVELSYDGGSNYIRSSDGAVSAIIGELVSSLDDHPAEYPDETHECVVRLDTYGAELEETTLAGMLNRTNLAAIGSPETGWELVNFANASQDSGGEWTLSEFLRGRKATEPREHPIGSKFVLLNRSVIAIEPMSVADIGRTLTFRATSFGTGTDTGTVVSMVYQGWTQKERSAAYLDASIDGDTLTADWMGVGRLGGGVSAQHGVRFTGYEVTLRSDEGVQTSMTTSQSVDLDVTSLTGALYVGISQVNSLTGPGSTIWWPNNPGDLTEVIFALGLSHPFVSARFIEREYFTDSADPYMVDTVNYEGATGNFVLRKYPVDASSDTDAIGTSFAGDVFFGAARDSATEDVLFIVSSIEPYQIGILRRLDVSEMIPGDTLTNLTTYSRGSNYVDAWVNSGELYGLKSSTIDVLDPDNLTEIRVLTLSVLAHRAILGTSDLWVAHRGGGTLEGQVHNLDKTDGSVIQTIETRRFPMGGAIYSGNLYVYCLNNSSPDPSPTGIGVFKYRLSDGVELDSWINPDDSGSYGATDVVVWLAGTRLGVGWAGHKVFDMATEAFV